VRKAAQKAIDLGYNTYTRYDGIPELREAIAAKQELFTGMRVDPENEIVVSAGATGALYCACLALLNPATRSLFLSPYYGYHISTLIATEAVPVHVRTCPPDWRFDMRALDKAWGRRRGQLW